MLETQPFETPKVCVHGSILKGAILLHSSSLEVVRGCFCLLQRLTAKSQNTSKGEVSMSLFDIHASLRLSFLGLLYEVVLPASDLKTSLRWSYTHLFIAYHILWRWLDHKLTIYIGKGYILIVQDSQLSSSDKNKWKVEFLFRATRHSMPMLSLLDEMILMLSLISYWLPFVSVLRHFLPPFILRWCLFIFLIRDSGYICPSTSMITSNIGRGWWYCLPSIVPHIQVEKKAIACGTFFMINPDDKVSSNCKWWNSSGFGHAKLFNRVKH